MSNNPTSCPVGVGPNSLGEIDRGGKIANICQVRAPVSWIKAARRDFEAFPNGAQNRVLGELNVAADGAFPANAKPLRGLGPGVYEIALRFHTDAYRAVYSVEFQGVLWVVHAFQKKSTSGIKTSKKDMDLVRQRIAYLKELLK